MSWLTDKTELSQQYATDANLRARQALWKETEGDDPKEILWRTLEAWQPQRVLEVGGGQGELAEHMQRELGADLAFLDLSPGMVELARARGIDARVGDAQELPFADGSFDAVVAAWMLYHVPDLDRALAEIARVLRPGGTLLAITNSAFHLRELRELVGSGPSPSTFTRENGQDLLSRQFASVRRIDRDSTVTFDDRAAVEDYVRASISMAPFVGNLPAQIDAPFIARTGSTIFVAEQR